MSLAAALAGSPYQGYLYAYPHKTAYRRLEPARDLQALWAAERLDAVFLYAHLPFCEMRCGFCNLFTTARVREGAVTRYLNALERQVRQIADMLGDATFVRCALGGGTPTFLEVSELERLLDLIEGPLGAPIAGMPTSVESSPETATPDRLALLAARGVERISIGIQSFVADEVKAIGRRQDDARVRGALDAMRSAGFPTLNLDLMYGLPGQTPRTWVHSLTESLRFQPEEIYLYPLYVRPLTGLGLKGGSWDDQRIDLYRRGRDLLLGEGYEQMSMRFFRKPTTPEAGPCIYRCQEDAMLGLGAGARSYTSGLHYSTEYAVGGNGVLEIIDAYDQRDDAAWRVADYGIEMHEDEQRRRWVILSLLFRDGVDGDEYRARFGTEVLTDLPQLRELEAEGCATQERGRLTLTPRGLERSDVIGPWLHSPQVRARMESYSLR